MGFQHPPRLFLRSDSENAQKMLGKTAHYDPQEKAVTLFTHNRHPKDILRSYAHELVHHTQNLRGDLSPEKCGEMGQGYAQANGHMREMEREAYEKGNMCFRDWEDTLNDKDTYIMIKIAESKNLKENKLMTTKITKEFLKETIRRVLLEKMSDEEFIEYGERLPAAKDTDAYKQAVARVAAKKKAAGDKQQAAVADIRNKALAQHQDANNKRDQEKLARLLNKAKRAAQVQLDDETEKAIEAAGKSIAPPGIDYHKRNPSGPSKEIVKKYNEKVLAINTDKKQKRVAIANSQDTQQVAAALSGKPSALNIDTAIASNMPTSGMGPNSSIDPSQDLSGPNSSIDPSQDLSGPNRSIDPSQDLSGPNSSIEPAAAAKPAAKKMSRRQLIRKRGAQTERLLPKYKPFNISNIKELQRVLVYLNILPPLQDNGDPQDDGKYGGGTMGAVQELQKQIGIPERKRDGVWGPATTKAIKMDSELMKKLKLSEMEAKLAGLPFLSAGDGDLSKLNLSGAKLPAGLDENEELEEGGKYDDKDSKEERCDYVKCDESKIQTPEQEDSLYESRFTERNNRLFENLSKKWTK